MINYLKSSVLLLIIDSIFVTLVSGQYANMVKSIQGTNMNINIIGTILSYTTLIFAYNWFILPDVIKNNKNGDLSQHKNIIINAFILGIVLYGVYDFTNMAIFNKWNLPLALIDVLWGGILFASITSILLANII
jgi:uncharacterized membrane protein